MLEVSVIIPCYNGFYLMNQCLHSLENQTCKEFEVIIVDDCSTDDSYQQLLKYKQKSRLRIELLRTSINSGPGCSRNTGICSAKGEYLAFCDCDDWYEENYIESMLEKAKVEKSDIVICNYRKVFDDSASEPVCYTKMFTEDSGIREFLVYSKSSFALLLIRKALFLNMEIPSLYNGEDMAIIPILMSRSEKISFLSQVLYNYYIRNDSASNNVSEKVYQDLVQAYDFVYQNIDLDKYYEEVGFIGIKFILYGATLNLLKCGYNKKQLVGVINKFQEKYPKWNRNVYLKAYNLKYKIYLLFLKLRLYRLLYIYAKLHQKYVQR